MQTIILAGGFGTRLRSVVADTPKVLAPINNQPFLYWLITYLQQQGVTNFIFSLGYLHHQIEDFLQQEFPSLNYTCVIEKEPLGTGGAIKLCMQNVTNDNVVIVNGDSFLKLNIQNFYQHHISTKSNVSIALKPMQNFDRYGSVIIDDENNVQQFNEKQYRTNGLINAGILIFNKQVFTEKTAHLPTVFSYEKDFLEPNIATLKITGFITNEYFIDIGIPEDYYKAGKEIGLVISKK